MKQKEFLSTVLPYKDKIYRLAKRLLVSSEETKRNRSQSNHPVVDSHRHGRPNQQEAV